ncbi:MAG: hypothetical protein V1813_03390 [Candidatus Aenigmatarchaeota archaeon]
MKALCLLPVTLVIFLLLAASFSSAQESVGPQIEQIITKPGVGQCVGKILDEGCVDGDFRCPSSCALLECTSYDPACGDGCIRREMSCITEEEKSSCIFTLSGGDCIVLNCEELSESSVCLSDIAPSVQPTSESGPAVPILGIWIIVAILAIAAVWAIISKVRK